MRLPRFIPPTSPLPRKGGGYRKGYTLLEVVLAMVVVVVSVASTLLIMSKLMSYTASRGTAFDIANAVTVSQIAIDRVRDQRFPPTGSYGDLANVHTSLTLSNVTYTYATEILASNGVGSGSASTVVDTEYDDATDTDSMYGYRNLLRVKVSVYKAGRLILETVTYKTRNGYY